MKILLVSISNHHFFQWANQLKDCGHEVYWFDVMDGGPRSEKIQWVNQIKGWKMRWDFPLRQTIKAISPKCYRFIQNLNERNTVTVFEKIIKTIQPDLVHCFEMNLSGLPILSVMQNHKKIKFTYSSWGSDMYYFKEHGVTVVKVQKFLQRVDYLITDCHRDYRIAVANGYTNKFLGVYPGNGGIDYTTDNIQPIANRKFILIKGYESFGCKASKIVDALQLLPIASFENFEIIIYSADAAIIEKVNSAPFFKKCKHQIIARTTFVDNKKMLKMMGMASIHVSNNISDGMPNTLLESVGMGAFPVQSNPGNASAEVITHGINGYLITDPLDENEIATWIEKAISNVNLRTQAQEINIKLAQRNYTRAILKTKISQLYQEIFL
ncbi:glycosyl transferase family 1 [Flavobacterium faecale]|uniref:Glycosyl transferase family 1 n=1 Tax=Flavobacterium faecale TaxID=1355330 RepID=A0A2S1LCN0_9FLAO|nr:glycosyltransferase [Flavobacterium faecale]AWG21458.1 glycosyl transferase family 1 [Flavobacterium faecale]